MDRRGERKTKTREEKMEGKSPESGFGKCLKEQNEGYSDSE